MRSYTLAGGILALVLTAASTAEVRNTTIPPDFAASIKERVEASSFGVIGDGRTDNTEALRRALGVGRREIHISPGDYLIGKLIIPQNVVLTLDPGATLRDSGKLGPEDRLLSVLAGNVYIRATGARLLASRDDYASGEQRHGVFIYGASNVVIEGLESSGHGGDGFYIGGPRGQPAQNISLVRCIALNNRRQGLSITSARHVDVIDSRFGFTRGAAPEYGIDLEPNYRTDSLEGIRLIRPQTERDHGGGILIDLAQLDAGSARVDITITGHVSVGESPPQRTIPGRGVSTAITYDRQR